MLSRNKWLKRGFTVASGVLLVVGLSAAPAQAGIGFSTTGAVGDAVSNGNYSDLLVHYDLYATDPLTDGHCAQWQRKIGDAAWAWIGSSSCGSKTKVADGKGALNWRYRICRTGVGNCSASAELP